MCLATERAVKNGSAPRSVSRHEDETLRTVFSYECGQSFATHGELRNHAHMSHGFVHPGRGFAVSKTCLACLTMFGTRDALVHHYRSEVGKKCLDLLAQLYTPLDAHHVHAMDQHAIIVRKQMPHTVRAVKLCGPRIDINMGNVPRSFSENDLDLSAS